MSEPFPILLWPFSALRSTVIFTFLSFFYFSRLRHGGTCFPALHGLNMPDIFTKRKPIIAYFVKLFLVIFTFYVDRQRPPAYSLPMALMPNERSANVPDVPVLPRNRPTPQGFLRPNPRKAQTQRHYQNRPRNLHPPLPQNHRRTHLQISHKETMR